MTREFALDGIGTLMDLLEYAPKGSSIISITIVERCDFEKHTYGHGDVEVHLNSNVDIYAVANKLGLPVLVDEDAYQDSSVLNVVDPQYAFRIFQLADKSIRE